MKEEFDALGAPFAERGKQTDEFIQIFREMWGRRLRTMEEGARRMPQARSVPAERTVASCRVRDLKSDEQALRQFHGQLLEARRRVLALA